MDYDRLLILTLCLVVGTMFATIGILLLIDTLQFLKVAIRTQGKVVSYEEREGRVSGHGSISFQYPQIEFEDQGGQKHCVTLAQGRDRRAYAIGNAVSILFNPERPIDVRIDSFSHLWQFPVWGIIGGFFGIGMAIGVWFS